MDCFRMSRKSKLNQWHRKRSFQYSNQYLRTNHLNHHRQRSQSFKIFFLLILMILDIKSIKIEEIKDDCLDIAMRPLPRFGKRFVVNANHPIAIDKLENFNAEENDEKIDRLRRSCIINRRQSKSTKLWPYRDYRDRSSEMLRSNFQSERNKNEHIKHQYYPFWIGRLIGNTRLMSLLRNNQSNIR
ncbi:hypothetical protein SSS_10331 [Sarcoptes scabiei]|nr:hypothetical protein SSS_10331 [Sarcoptes scabiei]